MLIELRIRDFAVLDDVSLELQPGLNVLSGETGAGKSIIVGALSLLLGERASSDVVRSGSARSVIEGVFDVSRQKAVLATLDDLVIEPEDGLLILRREVAAEGRNRAWVNGSAATAGTVGRLGTALVDLHGQHEHQTLLRPAEQRSILDAFAGARTLTVGVARLHAELRDIDRELERRAARRRELDSQSDFLRFQLEEIDGAEVQPGEDGALEDESRRLEHSEELIQDATRVHQELYVSDEALSDRLAELHRVLQRIAALDSTMARDAEALDGAYHAVVEVGRSLGDYASSVEHDPHRLEEVRTRLDRLFRLKRKYGPALSDVIATRERLRAELGELDGAAVDLEELTRRRKRASEALEQEAQALGQVRAEAAERLASQVQELLPELGMPGAVFRVDLTPLPEPGAGGGESVQFQAALNAGFEPAALSRIASGGELSRVMLALKGILANVDAVPTLVFDEIDAGIGGVVAVRVADKLREVAGRHQVFVVTHLPQLASRAHTHFLVRKDTLAERAVTGVEALDGEERVTEIARMLGGDPDSPTSRDHARELLQTV